MHYLKTFFERHRLKLPFMAFDILAMPLAWVLVYWFKYQPDVLFSRLSARDALLSLSILMTAQMFCYYQFKIYRGLWRFSSLSDVVKILKTTLGSIVLAIPLLYGFSAFDVVPRRVLPLYCLILTALLCGGRLFFRYLADKRGGFKLSETVQRVLVIGAGSAGAALVKDLFKTEYDALGFVDDDKSKQGLEVHGIRVLGSLDKLPELVLLHKIDLLLIATPSANSSQMQRIVNLCEQSQRPFQTLPSVRAIPFGQVDVNTLRKVKIEDLLGRDQVELSWEAISTNLQGRCVLVTGGGGSIGAELSRQILSFRPRKLVLLDHSEFNLYQIQHDLNRLFPEQSIVPALVSVTDALAVRQLFEREAPEIVFHAAAYKHVPLLEDQVRVAVINNVLGTQLIAQAAVEAQVEKFILISSDKAVNPTNIMGTTKRIAEIYCQNLNPRVSTQFITVRFGNVLGSMGSVVPLFQKQMETGGPLTVTDPQMQRYFMTIAEACQLILQSMVNGQGGEIFVLDMGEPVKITYLAEQIIRLAGKIPNKDIAIEYIGLRPGEKLFEELFHASEPLSPTEHEKLFKAQFRSLDWTTLSQALEAIHHACQQNSTDIIPLLKTLVPEFQDHSALKLKANLAPAPQESSLA